MHLQTAADEDDALAHYNLGQIQVQGLLLPQDLQQAKVSFGRAGALGYVPALVQLAHLLDRGARHLADPAQALALLQQASAQGDAQACYQLGRKYFFGDGVAQDLAQALLCYSQAAELGDSAAQFSLGSMYANGQGTAQDYALALRWYQAAAGQTPPPALASKPVHTAPSEPDGALQEDLRKAA
jgi:TPR repeat protein